MYVLFQSTLPPVQVTEIKTAVVGMSVPTAAAFICIAWLAILSIFPFEQGN